MGNSLRNQFSVFFGQCLTAWGPGEDLGRVSLRQVGPTWRWQTVLVRAV